VLDPTPPATVKKPLSSLSASAHHPMSIVKVPPEADLGDGTEAPRASCLWGRAGISSKSPES
jgi:hypothetical protein